MEPRDGDLGAIAAQPPGLRGLMSAADLTCGIAATTLPEPLITTAVAVSSGLALVGKRARRVPAGSSSRSTLVGSGPAWLGVPAVIGTIRTPGGAAVATESINGWQSHPSTSRKTSGTTSPTRT